MEQKDNSHTAAGRAHGLIWEPNYNDRILLRKGQLQRWLSYLDDNPRRLLLKRQYPEYFTQLSPIPVLISPGEQQIATACMEAGIPLIVLLLKGFPPYFKPQPRYLKACAEGRLLMLAPYPYQNEKLTDMRQRCLALNELARHICEGKQE